MVDWVNTFPHQVYASVLLLDGKIYNFKIGQRHWLSVFQVTMTREDMKKMERMMVNHIAFTVNNDEEHSDVFNRLAKDWFKIWDFHEDYKGQKIH